MTPRPTFNPLPACPNPIKWDVEGRIAELQAMIDSPATKEGQKINLQVAINMYHEKKLPAPALYIQKGKVISLQDLDTAYPFWVEGFGQQFSAQALIPAVEPTSSSAVSETVSLSPALQLASRVTYDLYPSSQGIGHQIFARIRGIPGFLLAPPVFLNITMLNDTGSSLLTVFDTDLVALGIPSTYGGYGPQIPISTAAGVLRQNIAVEMQLLDSYGDPMSDWFFENSVVVPLAQGVTRLSGNGIRELFYFATAPGNTHLYVAKKKNGIYQFARRLTDHHSSYKYILVGDYSEKTLSGGYVLILKQR
ncbi:hypothetical protein GTR04_0045 [Trichophyton interdigitale]|uniref:Uncharacterized protein n=1 Tax=Trichophyton interdigitale TaxID=101480 RepID=A0A9P4YNH2_9EURO|nr:hypothetical protein GY631_0993 [Trichophyton interdigitale]KAF3900976.1 hypothetical protein GY632_0376 [Trichophyton interdigitale]KAG8212559.1 hypothetical protein GTR04_0045 [Trichophyton interdigitale]